MRWLPVVILIAGCGGPESPPVSPSEADGPTAVSNPTAAPTADAALIDCGFATAEDLGKAMVKAVVSGDGSELSCAYAVLTDEPSRGGCLERLDDAPKFNELFTSRRDACLAELKGVDLPKLSVGTAAGGRLKSKQTICGREIGMHEDIAVGVHIDRSESGTSEQHTITVDDVFSVDGKLAITGDMLTCQGGLRELGI